MPWVPKGAGKGAGGKGGKGGGSKGGGKGGGWRNGLNWFDEAPANSWEGGSSWGGGRNYFPVFGVFEGKPVSEGDCAPDCECGDGFRQARRPRRGGADKKAARDASFASFESTNLFAVLNQEEDEELEEMAD